MALPLVFSAAGLFLAGFSFLFFLAYLRRRTGAERILAEFREEIDGMIRELNEVTVRDETLVEERVRNLRALLEEADRRVETFERRIATFDRELERRNAQDAVFGGLAQTVPVPGGVDSGYARLGNRQREPFAVSPAFPAGNGAAGGLEGQALPGAAGNGAGTPEPARLPPVPGPAADRENAESGAPLVRRAARQIAPKQKPFPEQALELYRAGLSAGLIAAKLGATITEVELAIALAGDRAGLEREEPAPSRETGRRGP